MKRFTEFGIAVGLILMAFPLLMRGAGFLSQWQLHQQWRQAVERARESEGRQSAHGLTGSAPSPSTGASGSGQGAGNGNGFPPENAKNRAGQGSSRPAGAGGHSSGASASHSEWQRRSSKQSAPTLDDIAQQRAIPRAPRHSHWGLVRLLIPRLDVDAIVMPGVTTMDLARGPGHYPYTDLPGQTGNCVIAAHRNMAGWWFDHLPSLEKGDEVTLETPDRHYVYRVVGRTIVHPDDTDVLLPHGKKMVLTLITCTHPATRRIVVTAVLDPAATASSQNNEA